MDDQFLKQYREAPRPEFARQLHNKLEGDSMKPQPKTLRRRLARYTPALIAAALIVAAVLVMSLPPTRALAQDFLNLFRVKRFATISIDPQRIQELEGLQLDAEKLLSRNNARVVEPKKPVEVASVQEASERAGFSVAVPATVPNGAALQVLVEDAGLAEFTANTRELDELLKLVGVTDVQLPPQLDGAQIKVSKPAAVMLQYTSHEGKFSVIQSPSPQVELPAGVELRQLGEIALRVLGLSPDQARDFAAKMDWNTTLLIPIPADAAQVRQVHVNGADALMLISNGSGQNPRGGRSGDTLILWAKDGMVYGLSGNSNSADLLEIANSVQ
ncbi:MAG: hypothetical protein IT331_02095 [Anaerolineae bacterium]|nr:hypothetical protein [Anaerolineae bacterium]